MGLDAVDVSIGKCPPEGTLPSVAQKKGTMPTVCAVIVAFHPDQEFTARLNQLLSQLSALVIVDNTPVNSREKRIEVPENTSGIQLRIIENKQNLGVAAALNQGLRQALAWECDWLLTLDQDSFCHADMVESLLAIRQTCIPCPSVIGSNYFDSRNRVTKVLAGENGEFLDQKTVITSGSLVNTRFAQDLGGFREDYFIDQLDHEFCLRVRVNGGRVVICRKPVMTHSVGESDGAWVPLLGYLPNHSPLRKYYIARNSVQLILTYWRVEPEWTIRRTLRLVLGVLLMATLEKQRMLKVKGFLMGVKDGFSGRLGPCAREELTETTNEMYELF